MKEKEREFKEFLLRALIEQAKKKIVSIEEWTKLSYTRNNLGYDIQSIIQDTREDLKRIKEQAEVLAQELGKFGFSWSEALKNEEKGS